MDSDSGMQHEMLAARRLWKEDDEFGLGCAYAFQEMIPGGSLDVHIWIQRYLG